MWSIKLFAAITLATLTPQQVLHDIDTKGANAVIDKAYNAGKPWDDLLEKIETGSNAWLDVARKLYPASDGAATVGLDIALSVALTHNPERVLEWTGQSDWPSIERVCTVRFIESDPKTDMEHVGKVKSALKRVSRPDLASKKAECLKFIEEPAAR